MRGVRGGLTRIDIGISTGRSAGYFSVRDQTPVQSADGAAVRRRARRPRNTLLGASQGMMARQRSNPARASSQEPWRGMRCRTGQRRAEQRQEAVEEAVILDEIARHHRIGHGTGEQLLDETMPTACDQPGSLAARSVSAKRSDMMMVPT